VAGNRRDDGNVEGVQPGDTEPTLVSDMSEGSDDDVFSREGVRRMLQKIRDIDDRQEVALAVIRHADRIRCGAIENIDAWGGTAGANAAKRRQRKTQREVPGDMDYYDHVPPLFQDECISSPEELCEMKELYTRAMTLVNAKPEREREVLLLVMCGFAYADIAAELKVSSGSIKSWVYRLHKALQALD
jgi:DNA-directed RNA polymerase specialized sigma24 family protein